MTNHDHAIPVRDGDYLPTTADQVFLSVRDGWIGFLKYLRDRCGGVELHSIAPEDELNLADKLIRQERAEEIIRSPQSPTQYWFAQFDRREDVVLACRRYCIWKATQH